MIHGWGGSASSPGSARSTLGPRPCRTLLQAVLGCLGGEEKARTQKGDRGTFPAPGAHSESRLAWVLAVATVMKQPQ